MKIVIHRGNSEIGAACLEIQSESGARIVLDAGAELEGEKAALPPGIGAADAVFISHAHPTTSGSRAQFQKTFRFTAGKLRAKLSKQRALSARNSGRAASGSQRLKTALKFG